MYKVVTLNTLYVVACLTFKLPHSTSGSSTFGGKQYTFNQTNMSCILQGSAVTFSDVVGSSQLWLQFVLFWDDANNQKKVLVLSSSAKQWLFWISQGKAPQLTGEVGKYISFHVKFSHISHSKNHWNRLIFDIIIQKIIRWTDFWDTVYVT